VKVASGQQSCTIKLNNLSQKIKIDDFRKGDCVTNFNKTASKLSNKYSNLCSWHLGDIITKICNSMYQVMFKIEISSKIKIVMIERG
ncbi:MAG TPA: hypothetical protein DDX14_00605, partial [Cyanobacteria bacterium UBA9579]|nr:hypothetical protein [Cyanobacteria bacterium UBA9579]